MATTTPDAGHMTAARGGPRSAFAIPVLAAGFRPFFLLAALWAAAAILLWLPVYSGSIALPASLAPLDWHIHEMLFGYPLTAPAGTQAIYLAAFVAALLRIVAACTGDHVLLTVAGLGWAGAFLGFAASYGPALVGWPSATRAA